MFEIQINDDKKMLNKKNIALIKKICNIIFKQEKLKGKILFELHLIDDDLSKEINNKYRFKNYSTDVISFSFWENSPIKTPLLGEIYLNYNKVCSQALEYNHSFDRELAFLVSHGVYHLLGYDHMTKEDENIMFSKQYDVLAECNLGKENDRK